MTISVVFRGGTGLYTGLDGVWKVGRYLPRDGRGLMGLGTIL